MKLTGFPKFGWLKMLKKSARAQICARVPARHRVGAFENDLRYSGSVATFWR